MTTSRQLVQLLLVGLVFAGCRGPKPPREQAAVCVRKLPAHLRHANADALPASEWFQLMFKNHQDELGTDLVDCSGEPIAWPELPDSCVEREPAGQPIAERRRLAQGDLVLRHASGDYWFAWVPFRRFGNGMGEGPVAIARVHAGQLEARALGTLRAYPGRPRLEVRKLEKQHMLVAQGEHCFRSGTCARGTRIMWLDRQRFRVRPLRSATLHSCLGPAWFPESELMQTRLSKRWTRSLQRSVALAFEPDRIAVNEHIAVNDRDLDQPSLPPRLFREAQAQLRVRIEAGEFLSEGQSLWNTIRIEDGSTTLDLAQR